METRTKKYADLRKQFNEEAEKMQIENIKHLIRFETMNRQIIALKKLCVGLTDVLDEVVDHMTDVDDSEKIAQMANEKIEEFKGEYIR